MRAGAAACTALRSYRDSYLNRDCSWPISETKQAVCPAHSVAGPSCQKSEEAKSGVSSSSGLYKCTAI